MQVISTFIPICKHVALEIITFQPQAVMRIMFLKASACFFVYLSRMHKEDVGDLI